MASPPIIKKNGVSGVFFPPNLPKSLKQGQHLFWNYPVMLRITGDLFNAMQSIPTSLKASDFEIKGSLARLHQRL